MTRSFILQRAICHSAVSVESGMGSYHGRVGFETFSHYRSIVDKKRGWICDPVSEIYRIERKDDADVFEIKGIILPFYFPVCCALVIISLMSSTPSILFMPKHFLPASFREAPI